MRNSLLVLKSIYFFSFYSAHLEQLHSKKSNPTTSLILHFFLISRKLYIYPDLLTLDTDVKIVTTNETFWSHMSFQVDSKANGASASNAMYSPLLLFQPSMKMGAW